jgi:hypothetical protein
VRKFPSTASRQVGGARWVQGAVADTSGGLVTSGAAMGRLLSNFADCICCGRGNRYQAADTWMNQPLNIFQPRSTATLEDLLEKSSRAREAVWQQLGSLEPLVLSHLVSPTLSGGPKWPALRQAFRLVRRPNGNVILASDGLSDPFDDITLGGGSQSARCSLEEVAFNSPPAL